MYNNVHKKFNTNFFYPVNSKLCDKFFVFPERSYTQCSLIEPYPAAKTNKRLCSCKCRERYKGTDRNEGKE